jgi:hypothetical protein
MQARSAEQLRSLADQYRGLLSSSQLEAMQSVRMTEAKTISAPSPAMAPANSDSASNRERLRTPEATQQASRPPVQSAGREQLGEMKPQQTPKPPAQSHSLPKRERGGPSR